MTPKVSIIVNTWSEKAKPYLDLCMESIERLDYPRANLDVVLVGRKSYIPQYTNVKCVAPDSDDFGNELGQNFGVSHTDKTSDFLFLINDDVILTKDCLKNMVSMAGQSHCLMVPISPCDTGWKHHLVFGFFHDERWVDMAQRFYRIDDLKPYKDSLMQAYSRYPWGAIVTDKLCLFAVLIPRKTWDMVGPMDENFSTGQSDFDYSIRARQLNVPRLIALNALVWHFGGATSTDSLTSEKRDKNAEYFRQKWPNETLY